MSKNPLSTPLAMGCRVLAATAGLSACSTVSSTVSSVAARVPIPWRHPAPPPPSPVSELAVDLPSGPQVPVVLQYREGDTLVVDLQGAAATGELTLRPGESGRWPARLALRAQPGRFEVIEVRGAQRVRLPISGDKGSAVTVPVAPVVHVAGTPALRLSWGAVADDLH